VAVLALTSALVVLLFARRSVPPHQKVGGYTCEVGATTSMGRFARHRRRFVPVPQSWSFTPLPQGCGLATHLIAVVAAVLVVGIVQLGCGSGGGGTGGGPTTTPPGGAATAALSPSSLTFGNQAVGTTSLPQSVTLSNNGTAALTIGSIAASGDFAQTNSCGGSVAAGGRCSISVTFTPSAAGARGGSLGIADNATGSPHTVALAGTGVSASAGTPAGTYAITVAGTAGTLARSASVSLTVR
jgi:hypothetical protein